MVFILALGAGIDGFQTPQRQIGVRFHHAAIESYRALLKPLIEGSTRCKFKITCSEYSLRVVSEHGWPKGGLLTIQRLARCR